MAGISKRIHDRVILEANYLIENNATYDEVGEYFGIERTCIFRDLKKILPMIDLNLYHKTRKVFENNRRVRGYKPAILVAMIKNDGSITTYRSINEAARELGIYTGNIRDVLDKPNRSCLGHRWIRIRG